MGLSIAVFTADMTNIFISVSAPISNGNRHSGQISLMFVAENDARFVPEILELLQNRNVQTTWFIGGNWANENRDLVQKIASNHEIGNHGKSNRPLATLNESAQRAEIHGGHDILHSITDNCSKLFLPPHASFNNRTMRITERLGYRAVMWSRDASSAIIFNKAVFGVQSGDFIKLRPSLQLFSVLNNILNEYATRNLRIIPVGQNI